MENLLSNTAFGDYLETLDISNSAYRMLRSNFDRFLKQVLEIWMFVPCKFVDGVWVVLEEPNREDYMHKNKLGDESWNSEYDLCKYKERTQEYKEAKERVLFGGFEIHNFNGRVSFCNEQKEFFLTYLIDHNEFIGHSWRTAESVSHYNLTLTATAKKQIGL
jgi:hypothetical protein